MKYAKLIGMGFFVAGIILLIAYGLYEGFRNISLEDIDIIVSISILVILLGLVILFISILFEQKEGKKKLKQDIKKEDLEP